MILQKVIDETLQYDPELADDLPNFQVIQASSQKQKDKLFDNMGNVRKKKCQSDILTVY